MPGRFGSRLGLKGFGCWILDGLAFERLVFCRVWRALDAGLGFEKNVFGGKNWFLVVLGHTLVKLGILDGIYDKILHQKIMLHIIRLPGTPLRHLVNRFS